MDKIKPVRGHRMIKGSNTLTTYLREPSIAKMVDLLDTYTVDELLATIPKYVPIKGERVVTYEESYSQEDINMMESRPECYQLIESIQMDQLDYDVEYTELLITHIVKGEITRWFEVNGTSIKNIYDWHQHYYNFFTSLIDIMIEVKSKLRQSTEVATNILRLDLLKQVGITDEVKKDYSTYLRSRLGNTKEHLKRNKMIYNQLSSEIDELLEYVDDSGL